jgi:hypothetical protein
MPSGPSKQELEMYWQNSRQYFDELAAHYKQADPRYYKEYIEPFYTNPFANVHAQRQNSSSSAKPILIIVAFLVFAFGGLAAFGIIYFTSQQPDSKEIEKLFESTDKQEIKPKEEKSQQEKAIEEDNSDPSELSPEDNFIIGSKYLGEKKYDKAEYHLRKVKPGEKYYKESQQLLESMKYLRQYNK